MWVLRYLQVEALCLDYSNRRIFHISYLSINLRFGKENIERIGLAEIDSSRMLQLAERTNVNMNWQA